MAHLIWTEKEPDGTAWEDCTYCSLLMVLEANGTPFPLGARTHAERIAFRGGDPRLNFAGGVTRAMSRYNKSVKRISDGSAVGLAKALSSAGNAYAVAGKLSNFPAGHTLRAYAPNFTGFHAIAVIPDGKGSVVWMDPLAPMNAAPKVRPIADVLSFAKGNFPNDARYLPVKEDTVSQTLIKEKDFPEGNWTASIAPGQKVDGYDADSLVKTQVWPQGSTLQVSGTAIITQNPKIAPNGTFRVGANGLYAGLYIPVTQITLVGPTNPAPPATDCSALEKQVEDLQTNLLAMTKVANAANDELDKARAAVKTLADL